MMRVTPIACLKDNYAYLVVCEATGEAAVVDPSEGPPVVEAVRREGVRPVAVWSTHHHWDHVGGNEEVARELGVQAVFGHASDKGRIPAQTRFLEDGETFSLGELAVRALHIPGHTLGAVAYVVTPRSGPAAVFTGDTMFLAGCGRLFEGTPADMYRSLGKLTALPPDTKVYCGHEYTESNLAFAAHVEPENPDIQRTRERVAALRARGEPSVPGTIAEEQKVNPFLRVDSAAIRATLSIAASADGPTALGIIRKAKDVFR